MNASVNAARDRVPPSRRRRASEKVIVGGLAFGLAAVGVVTAGGQAAAEGEGELFAVPPAATVRSLGDIAEGTCPMSLPYECNDLGPSFIPIFGFQLPDFPATTPGLGIPLGGIGAGNFMINQSGTFGAWWFGGSQNQSYEVRALPQAAFHVREQVGDGDPTVTTLATDGPERLNRDDEVWDARSWESPLSGWNTLDTGDAEYSMLYPFGWMDYETLQTDVSMRFYSPIVAGEDRRSSLPVAYFDVQITNPSDEPAEISTMFTMPNVAGHEGRTPATVREGLSSEYHVDESTGIHAVTLSSDSEANTPDAYKSEWTIAAQVADGESVSYVTSWDASGDGADIYSEFSDDGALTDGALDDSASAGAIAVSATVEPGETTTIPFVLTWDFPQVGFQDNSTVWMRRYTEFYGAQTDAQNNYIPGSYPFHQSYAMAADALEEHDASLADILDWWSPIAESTVYPDWLKEAALNQLADIPFSTVLWENGLVRNDYPTNSGNGRAGDDVPGTHNYLGVDASAGGMSTNGMGGEIAIYGSNVYSDYFPSIERDRLVAKAEAILAPNSMGDPWDFSLTEQDGDNPFISWRQGTDAAPGKATFLDRPSNNIYRMYDYAQRNDDEDFLEFVYPAMIKTLDYLQRTIPDDVPLPEVPSKNYPKGTFIEGQEGMASAYNGLASYRFDSYTSSLYILALESMIASGRLVGEADATVASWEEDLASAKAAFEDLFWLESEGYYRHTLPEPDQPEAGVAMIATFLSQNLAERAGLPDVVDRENYERHLATVYPFFTEGTDGFGAALTGSATEPIGGQVTPQSVFSFAANAVSAGRFVGDDGLVAIGLEAGEDVARQLWQNEANGYAFNTPSYDAGAAGAGNFLYPGWEGNLAVFQLVDALDAQRDATAPEVSASVDGRQVTIVASDDGGTGVESVEYRVGTFGDWLIYGAPIDVPGEDATVVQFRAADRAGNISNITSVDIPAIVSPESDVTPPKVTATVHGRQVTITASDDGGTGVASVQYRVGTSGDWLTYGSPIDVPGVNATVVQFRAADRAGNASEVASVDVPAVTSSDPAVVLSASTATPGDVLTVSMTGIEREQVQVGIASTYRQLAVASPSNGAAEVAVTIPLDVEAGDHHIQVRAADGSVLAEAPLTVVAADGENGVSGDGTAGSAGEPEVAGVGGGLAMTGPQVTGLAMMAFALLLAGAWIARRYRLHK